VQQRNLRARWGSEVLEQVADLERLAAGSGPDFLAAAQESRAAAWVAPELLAQFVGADLVCFEAQ